MAVVAASSVAGAPTTQSGPGEELVEAAIEQYTQALQTDDSELKGARFRQAARLFRQAIENSQISNSDLYTNLGNAALASEDLGHAIVAYQRALAVEPGHQKARLNLKHARQQLPDWVRKPASQTLWDTFFYLHRTLSQHFRQLAASLCFLAFAVLAAIAIRWGHTWSRTTALLPAALWVALVGSAVWDRWASKSDSAVVTAPEVVARSADASAAPPRFARPLPAGTEVTVLERRDKWARVRLANHRDAWVRASALTIIFDR